MRADLISAIACLTCAEGSLVSDAVREEGKRKTYAQLLVRLYEQMQLRKVVRSRFLARLVVDTLEGNRSTGRLDELRDERSVKVVWREGA